MYWQNALRLGRQRHVILTTSGHDLRMIQLDMLRASGNGPQARTTDLIGRPCRTFLRQACVDTRLTAPDFDLGHRMRLQHLSWK